MNGKHLGIGKMDKQYNISNIDFNGELMILSVDGKTYQIPIIQASKPFPIKV